MKNMKPNNRSVYIFYMLAVINYVNDAKEGTSRVSCVSILDLAEYVLCIRYMREVEIKFLCNIRCNDTFLRYVVHLILD